jgi:UDP-glucose 4-epimerase
VLHLAEVVSRAFGVEPAIAHLEARNEVVHAYASHEKARRIFGAAKPVTLDDGIERMASWARRVGARESSTFGEIEIRKNLPKSWAISAGG